MKFIGQTHIGIFVKDAEASAKFYRDVFSFEILWQGENPDTDGIYKLALARNNDLILEMVQPPAFAGREIPGPVDHIAIKTDDVYAAFDYLRGLGYAPLSDAVIEAPGLFGTGAKYFFIIGPDGERIEVAQG